MPFGWGYLVENGEVIQLRDLLKDYLGLRLKDVEPEAAVTEGAPER